ncbi:MAG: TIGR03089 family protein [Candidatus Nanopelagicales bacterium]
MVSLRTTREAAQPFVTYYDGETGERTELSATSLLNWQAKTANYLRDGLALDAGESISLSVPPHWVVPVWVGAAQLVGAHLRLGGGISDETADIAVIGPNDVSDPPKAHTLVACSLLPLAQPFPSELPAAIEDYFGEVRQHGDFFASDTSAQSAATDLQTRELVDTWGLSRGARIMVVATSRLSAAGLAALYDVPRAIDGSVVIVANSTSNQLASIRTQEQIDTTVPV